MEHAYMTAAAIEISARLVLALLAIACCIGVICMDIYDKNHNRKDDDNDEEG